MVVYKHLNTFHTLSKLFYLGVNNVVIKVRICNHLGLQHLNMSKNEKRAYKKASC